MTMKRPDLLKRAKELWIKTKRTWKNTEITEHIREAEFALSKVAFVVDDTEEVSVPSQGSPLEQAMAMMMQSQVKQGEVLSEINEWIKKIASNWKVKTGEVLWDFEEAKKKLVQSKVAYQYIVQKREKVKALWGAPTFTIHWPKYNSNDDAIAFWKKAYWDWNFRIVPLPIRLPS